MGSTTAQFVRRENVKRYRDLLEATTDLEQRRLLTSLLAEEEVQQIENGDFGSGTK